MVRHEVLHLTMYVQLCITLIYSVYPCMYSIHKVVDGPLMTGDGIVDGDPLLSLFKFAF